MKRTWRASRSQWALLGALALCFAFVGGIYSVSDLLLFRPIIAKDPDQIVYMLGLARPTGIDFVQWWSQAQTVSPLAVYRKGEAAMIDRGDVTLVAVALTAGDFFSTLGIRPLQGRFFTAEELESPIPRAAVLSAGFWRTRFGGQPVLGRYLEIAGAPVYVVGIAPAGFCFPGRTQVWVAARGFSLPGLSSGTQGPLVHRDGWVGRLANGVGVGEARAELMGLLSRLREVYTTKTGIDVGSSVSVRPLREALGRNVRTATWAMVAGAAALLLIAIMNAAVLFAYESLQRTREFATRMTVGATIWALVRQRTWEIVRTVVAAAVAGYVLWMGFAAASRSMLWTAIPIAESRQLAGIHVLTVCLVTAFASAIIAAVPTLLQLGRGDLLAALKEYHHQTAATRQHRLQRILVMGQVALAITLAASALLAFRSFRNLTAITNRLNTGEVLTGRVESSTTGASLAALALAYEELIAAAGAVPGVESAAGAAAILPDRSGTGGGHLWILVGAQRFLVQQSLVTREFFETMRVPITHGRTFARRGTGVVIDTKLAHTVWGNRSPLGAELTIDGEDSPRHVVGVVSSGGLPDRDESAPWMYLPISSPYRNMPPRQIELVVRARSNMRAVARHVHHVIASDNRLRFAGAGFESMQDRFDLTVLPDKSRTLFLTCLAAIGVLVAGIGVVGVVSRRAYSRVHEMAVRMVHGATGRHVAWLILADALEMILVGAIFGVVLSFAAAKLMRSILFGVSELDGPSLAAGALLLIVVGAAAAAVPAARTARINIRSALS